MRRIGLGLLLLMAAGTLAGCRLEKPPPPAPPAPRVTVIRPAVVPVRDYWTYNGYLDTSKSVDVKSKIRGFLADVLFAEGTEVEVGDPLYTIDKLEYQTAVNKASAEVAKDKAQVENWKAQIVQAKADLDRVSKAFTGGGESKTELDKAQATYDIRIAEKASAEASLKAAEAALRTANIQLGYTDIRAKIAGRISRTLVDEGNLVLADTTLLTTIVRMDELYINFDAPETDFFAYQKAQLGRPNPVGFPRGFDAFLRLSPLVPRVPSPDQVAVEVGVADEIGYPHAGYIDFRENRVENATGTIRVRGVLDNPRMANNVRLLVPGMYARVRVPKSDPVPLPVVPEDCLVSGQEGRFLRVVKPDGTVRQQLVTVGASVWKASPPEPGKSPPSWVAVNPSPAPPADGKPPAPTRREIKSMVAITAGLKSDDRVILDGLQQARPGAPVSPEEWNLKPPGDEKK